MKNKSEIDRIIYVIRNLITKKKYIGQTYLKKYNKSYWGGGTHITDSVNFYGKENFTRDILMHYKDYKESNLAEIYCVKHLNTREPNGYNGTPGGDGNTNPSEETRKIISEKLKGKKKSPETITKRIATMNAKSDEEKAIICKNKSNGRKNMSSKAKKLQRQKQSESMKGKNRGKKSLKTRKKMSDTKKNMSDESKKIWKQKVSNTKRNWSDERKLQISKIYSDAKNNRTDEEKELWKQKMSNTKLNKSDIEKKLQYQKASVTKTTNRIKKIEDNLNKDNQILLTKLRNRLIEEKIYVRTIIFKIK